MQEIRRDINVITAEFVAIKRQTEKMILDSAVEMGRRLCEAKLLLNHGEWGNWLKDKAEISSSTASNLMKVFEDYGAEQFSLFGAESNSQTFGNLTYSKAVALFAIPLEDREEFIKEHDVENISTRELQEAIKEKNAAEKEKETALKEKEIALIEKEKADKEISLLNQRLADADREINELLEDNKEVDTEAVEQAKKETAKEFQEKLKKAEQSKLEIESKLKSLQSQKTNMEIELKNLQSQKENKSIESEKELKSMAEKIQELEKKLAISSSTEAVEFKIHFESVQKSLNKMIDCIGNTQDEKSKESLTNAIKSLCNITIDSI